MAIKGQPINRDTVEKINIAKQQKLLSKYNWEYAEPYLDVELNISSNKTRSKNFITLGDFKSFIESGKSLKDLKKEGVSKHLIQFFSAFCQGKITLNKEEFIKQYNEGLSLDDICKKYSIPKDHIGFLRQLFEKKKTGANYIKRKETEIPLTQRQIEILYGSMMGDAKKISPSAAGFNHNEKQKDYLLWKYNEFKNISSANSLKGTSYLDNRKETETFRWSFYTNANTDIEECISLFYQNQTKEITKSILEKLTPLSIAVWYMDDGHTDWGYRNKIRDIKASPIFTFCTESFSKKSCELIKAWFLEKYNIYTELKERKLSDRIGHRIQISIESVTDFIKLIKPYILPLFNYKINYEEYVNNRLDKEHRKVGYEVLKCPLGADFSILPINEQSEIIDDIVCFYQSKGITFLIDKENQWQKHVDSVLKNNPENLIKNEYISFSNLGNKFLMSHFPNFWTAKAKGRQSPKEVFNNKEFLTDIVRKIVIQGYFPSKEKILKGLQRYRGNKQVSGFMPCVAKSIFHKYCQENSKVFDFCAGYGGRLFGAIACNKVKSYTCCEVNFETYSNLHELYRTLRLHNNITKEVNIINQDSIIGMSQFSDNSFDFCFTSPPYYDAEIYSNDKSQSCNKFNNYSDWFDLFLIKAITEARRISKKVAINIANTGGYMIADDLERWLNINHIEYVKDKIKMPFYGGNFKFEPIFIF